MFRKLNNGTVTLATLRDEQLLEVEVKNCNCEGTIISIERFKSLEEFLQYCNRINNFYISLDPKIAYKVPVARKNPFSLEEMTRFCVAECYIDSINELIIPKMIKKLLQEKCYQIITILIYPSMKKRPVVSMPQIHSTFFSSKITHI